MLNMNYVHVVIQHAKLWITMKCEPRCTLQTTMAASTQPNQSMLSYAARGMQLSKSCIRFELEGLLRGMRGGSNDEFLFGLVVVVVVVTLINAALLVAVTVFWLLLVLLVSQLSLLLALVQVSPVGQLAALTEENKGRRATVSWSFLGESSSPASKDRRGSMGGIIILLDVAYRSPSLEKDRG